MPKAAEIIYQHNLDSRVTVTKENGCTYFPSALNEGQVAELKSAINQLKADEESFSRHSILDNLLVGRKTGKSNPGFFEKSINNAFNHELLFLEFLDLPKSFI